MGPFSSLSQTTGIQYNHSMFEPNICVFSKILTCYFDEVFEKFTSSNEIGFSADFRGYPEHLTINQLEVRETLSYT